MGEYARGGVHINTCEGEFSMFRPFMAVHRGVAKYNVPLYASLFQVHRQIRQMEAPSALKHALKTILFFLLLQKLQAGIRSSPPTTLVY